MGDFRIIIDAVGGHGQDRGKKDGEIVDFKQASDNYRDENTPEAIALRCVEELKTKGCSVQGARVIHWPADNYPQSESNPNGRMPGAEVVDDLLTGIRKNNF